MKCFEQKTYSTLAMRKHEGSSAKKTMVYEMLNMPKERIEKKICINKNILTKRKLIKFLRVVF